MCVIDPELAVNDTVVEPAETFAAADIVSCWEVPTVREKLLGDTLMPDGVDALTCTLLESPFTSLTEICADWVPPAAITRVAGCADNEKSGWGPDGPPPPHETNEHQITATARLQIAPRRIPDFLCPRTKLLGRAMMVLSAQHITPDRLVEGDFLCRVENSPFLTHHLFDLTLIRLITIV